MLIPLVNDTHAGKRNDSLAVNDYFFRFWDEIFFPYLEKNKIKTIFHLGDLVDRRKFMNYVILNKWRKGFMERIGDMDITMHCLVGNHDVPYRNTNEINAIQELFGDLPNIKIYSEAQDVNIEGITYAFIPWINNTNLEQTFKYIETSKAQVAFGHLELNGFEMDRGNVCYGGLNRELFDKFDMVISGHFHLRSTDGHIFYLGAQYEFDWGDYGSEKGFHVFNTADRDLTYIENPFKLHHKIVYDDKKDFDFEYLQTVDLNKYANTYTKIIVVNKSNPYLFDTFIDYLGKVGPLNIDVVEDFSEMLDGSEDALDQTEDTMTILNKHVDSLKLENVDLEKLKGMLREIYVEAVSLESA